MSLRALRCPTPDWFVSELVLKSSSVVVVVDDENSVSDYWRHRLTQVYDSYSIPDAHRARLVALSSPNQLQHDDSGSLTNGTVFLVDYDFGPREQMTGIELIETLGIRDGAILVTAHSDEPGIIDDARSRRIKVLPKTFMYSFRFKIKIGDD